MRLYSYTGVWPLIDRMNARARKAREAAAKVSERDRAREMEAAEVLEHARLRRKAAAFEMGVVVTRRPAGSVAPNKISRAVRGKLSRQHRGT